MRYTNIRSECEFNVPVNLLAMNNLENYHRETLEYRVHDTAENNQVLADRLSFLGQKPIQLHASTTRNVIFPSKKQTIIIDSVEDVNKKLRLYLR